MPLRSIEQMALQNLNNTKNAEIAGANISPESDADFYPTVHISSMGTQYVDVEEVATNQIKTDLKEILHAVREVIKHSKSQGMLPA